MNPKSLLLLVAVVTATLHAKAQYGTLKWCPGTPAWNANLQLVTNENEMYEEYAKGPDGCWWLKSASWGSYPKGTFTFITGGKKTYYTYDPKKKVWSSGNACVANPFTRK